MAISASKIISTALAVIGLGGIVTGFVFLDDRHLHADEGKALIAQTAKSIQQDITSIRIQQIQWELKDIYAREKNGSSFPGDRARKIELEARLKELSK